MAIKQLLNDKQNDIKQIAAKHGAYNIRIFGSVVRGEETENSDIDFLVDTGPEVSPWFPGGLIFELEQLLGHPIEIVTEKGLNPLIRNQVLKEAISL
jgi:uncharacterized protein